MSRRIATGNDAQLVVLPSVSGYFEFIREIPAENFTLKETVDAMKAHLPDALNGLSRERLDAMVRQKLELAEASLQYENGQGLNVQQAAALRLYTADSMQATNMYSLVNNNLRTRHALSAFVPFIWLLLNALKNCPVFTGTNVYRGIKVEGAELTTLLARYRPNMRHRWYCFTSTSAVVSVQERFLGENVYEDRSGNEHRSKKGVIFHIQLRPGARVISKYSDYPDEEEILLPPNFIFEVVDSSSPVAGLHILQLRELETDDVLLDMNSAKVSNSPIVAEASKPILVQPNQPQMPPQWRFEMNDESLLRAAKDGCCEYLLSRYDVNVNCKDNVGYTPLHWSASGGHMEDVTHLIALGADICCKDNYGRTPLHLSAHGGHLEVVKYLLQLAPIPCKDENGKTPLHYSSNRGHLEVVKYLLQQGADVHCRDNNYRTPLHLSAKDGHLEVVKYLVQKGADIHCKDLHDWTPLHSSVQRGHLEVVKYLVQKGADIHCKDDDGKTPYDYIGPFDATSEDAQKTLRTLLRANWMQYFY